VQALERGDATAAIAAAKQMGGLSLGDALALCVVLSERDPGRFRRAAPRWLARFVDECADVSLEEAQLVSAALAALPAAPYLGRPVLRELVRVRQLVTVKSVFEDVISV
jgi:hypothetical protein